MFFLFPFMLIWTLPNLLMAFAAVIPAVFLIVRVYKMDKIEKEPVGLILRLIFMGMLATAGAIITETIGSALINADRRVNCNRKVSDVFYRGRTL